MPHELGALRSEHRLKGSSPWVAAFAVLLLGGMGVLFCALPFFEDDPQMTLALKLLAPLMGIPFVALAVLIAWTRVRDIGRWFQLYERGLVEHRGSAARALRWTEGRELRVAKDVVHQAGGLVSVRRESYVLRDADGRKLAVDHTFRGIAELGRAIDDGVTFALLPTFRARLARGEAVSFGKLALMPHGIAAKARTLAWVDVIGADVESGRLRIFERGEAAPWTTLPYAALANARVFLALVDERRVDTQLTAPRSGPLRLHANFRRRSYGYVAFGVALGMALGVGMATLAMYWAYRADDAERVWQQGTPALESHVRTFRQRRESLVLSCDVEIEYRSADGRLRVLHAEFERILDAPNPHDPIQVRYLPANPERAASSWEHDSFVHMVVLGAIFLAFGMWLSFVTLRDLARSRKQLHDAEELARSGRLAWVSITNEARDANGMRVLIRYRYQTPRGLPLEYAIAVSEGGAYRRDGRALALLAYDEHSGVLLTRTGYPLTKDAFVDA